MFDVRCGIADLYVPNSTSDSCYLSSNIKHHCDARKVYIADTDDGAHRSVSVGGEAAVQPLVVPNDDPEIIFEPVSTHVNKVANNNAQCVQVQRAVRLNWSACHKMGHGLSHRLRYLYRAYRYRYRGDRAEIRFMCERLRRGDVAVDVGCFKGAYTYWMRRCVGAEGEVVAFEPQPRQVEYLRNVVAAMKWRNVEVVANGVSDATGELKLYQPASGHEATFVKRGGEHAALPTIAVPVTTLDALFAGRERQPAFIKIDVEGHESAVLAGARGMLEKSRPTIMVECEARHRADRDVRPLLDMFTALGYEGSFFECGRRRPLAEFDAARHQRYDAGKKLPKGYVNNFAFEHPARSS